MVIIVVSMCYLSTDFFAALTQIIINIQYLQNEREKFEVENYAFKAIYIWSNSFYNIAVPIIFFEL